MNRDDVSTELHHVVAQARDIGVALAGAYDVRSPRRDVPDYTIEITPITNQAIGIEGECGGTIDDPED